MSKGNYIILGLCAILLILLAGCTSTTVNSGGSVPSSSSSKGLELIESHIEPDQYGVYNYVVGSVKNNDEKTYKYVQVTINLYDKSGAQVGSTLANVNNLEPGVVWKFKAPMIERDATSYKIKEITGL